MKNYTKIYLFFLLFLAIPLLLYSHDISDPPGESLDPCPGPEREIRSVYRSCIYEEEKQYSVGGGDSLCGGEVLLRTRQEIGVQEIQYTTGGGFNELECSSIGRYRYLPDASGEVFEDCQSWQMPWPMEMRGEWLTQEDLLSEYGEPIPLCACQGECLESPPGNPSNLSEVVPHYYNTPHYPELLSGDIASLVEKNILGGSNPLKSAPLPVKLHWWHVPGWKDGFLEDGMEKECQGPEDIKCVTSYIIRFDNINSFDGPVRIDREVILNYFNIDENSPFDDYLEAQRKYEALIRVAREAYDDMRRRAGDHAQRDVIRSSRDNILGCNECGEEKEIWLDINTFNPLSFEPKFDYYREDVHPREDYIQSFHRVAGQRLGDDYDDALRSFLENEVLKNYGYPCFFRSGAEHTYSLKAACSPHDYLIDEDDPQTRFSKEAVFSFKTSDAPEPIYPLDSNWVLPYDPKEYDPGFDPNRLFRIVEITDQEGEVEEVIESMYIHPVERLAEDFFFSEEEHSFTRTSLREEVGWCQTWIQEDPSVTPYPPTSYRLNLGQGIIVSAETSSDYPPVAEDCHHDLTEGLREEKQCVYRSMFAPGGGTGLSYPRNYLREGDYQFFTVPEDPSRDIYSWNVSACGETICSDYSQLWRFQVDPREKDRIHPPVNRYPANLNDERIEKRHATPPFPFAIEWSDVYGARSFVFHMERIIEEGEEPAEGYKTEWVRVTTDTRTPFTIDDLEIDTRYNWRVKSCWDSLSLPDDMEDDVEEKLNWIDENKQCGKWSSESWTGDFFGFSTTGWPPEELIYPVGGEETIFPVDFHWERVPGAMSYIIKIEHEFTLDPGGSIVPGTGIADWRMHDSNRYTYPEEVNINEFYSWKVSSCAMPMKEDITITSDTLDEIKDEYKCGVFSDLDSFSVYLSSPENLSPGGPSISEPEEIDISESFQILSWDPVKGAGFYRINIYGPSTNPTNLVNNQIIERSHFLFQFPSEGVYVWSVSSCIDSECEIRSIHSSAYVSIITRGLIGGVVPCGRQTENPNTSWDDTEKCGPIHLFLMAGLILEEVLVKTIIPFSLVVLLIYTSVLYYTGFGRPDTMQRVTSLWKAAGKGYLIILLAWVVINNFLHLVGYNFGAFGNWWDIGL